MAVKPIPTGMHSLTPHIVTAQLPDGNYWWHVRATDSLTGVTSPFSTVSDAPILTFLTGNFVADGNLNVGWMNYPSPPTPAATSMAMSRYTPLYSGSAWQWHETPLPHKPWN